MECIGLGSFTFIAKPDQVRSLKYLPSQQLLLAQHYFVVRGARNITTRSVVPNSIAGVPSGYSCRRASMGLILAARIAG
jgi:hypothetical protein